jgi:hypothetical protein
MHKSDEHTFSRRCFLKQTGAGILASVGGLSLPSRAQATITYESWVHGHAVILDESLKMSRASNHVVVYNDQGSQGWNTCYFVIPTPAVINDRQMKIIQVMLDYFPDIDTQHIIQVYDGSDQLFTYYPRPLGGRTKLIVPILGQPFIVRGIAIEVKAQFSHQDRLIFYSAGADFF